MKSTPTNRDLAKTIKRFIRFGLVGTSGVAVDMGVLYLLTDPKFLPVNILLSKPVAAEVAIVNNFAWNEFWTFADTPAATQTHWQARFRRFAKFNLICLAGIGLSLALIKAQLNWLGMNVYLANLIAIIVVSLWNFVLTLKFGWNEPTYRV
ncbi:MAG: GtrA family protein [Verrucomicrobiae bacterium]|nr:GtrA family protein [Verrucomicrobiae bacterium]